MSELVLLSHIPLLRIQEPAVPMGIGQLYQLPFEDFDGLTGGAWSTSTFQRRYEQTAPVFFRARIDVPTQDRERRAAAQEEKQTRMEVKFHDFRETMRLCGLDFMIEAYDALISPVWKSLLLAAPAASIPCPLLSVTFLVAELGEAPWFQREGESSRVLHVQGDADLELLFRPEAASAPLPAEALRAADALLPSIAGLEKQPDLGAALESLHFATSLPLSPFEQLTFSVVALEALLLPEIKSSLGATFARRLSNLLGTDAEHRSQLRTEGAELYRLRSGLLHGSAGTLPSAVVENAYAQQLLAAAILALGRERRPLAQVRLELDKEASFSTDHPVNLSNTKPAVLRPEQPLIGAEPEVGVTLAGPGATLGSEEGTLLCWAPLAGLGLQAIFAFQQYLGSPMVLGFSGPEILALEHKDIARDFIAKLNVKEEPMAVLSLVTEKGEPNARARLERRRDLAVVALRLAGFSSFIDPEMLSFVVYDGLTRYRWPSVFRQTVLHHFVPPCEHWIGPESQPLIEPFWDLLEAYDQTCPHADVNAVLTLFRRTFDRTYQPPRARAASMFSALEMMLGRFRPFAEKVQLEDLVAYWIAPDAPAMLWFRASGRAFRNGVAHGSLKPAWEGDDPLEHLAVLLQAILPAFLECWLAACNQPEPSTQSPGRIFIAETKRLIQVGRAA